MSKFIQHYKKLGIDVRLVPIIPDQNQFGGVYISNFLSAMSYNLLKQKNIQAIISLGKSCCLPYNKQQIPNYLYIPIEDKAHANISQYFQKCISFIERCRKKTNVLVHCRAGVSRSSTIILAYLINKYKYGLNDAYVLLRRAHKRAKPNQGFIKQLEAYCKEITGEQQHFEIKAESTNASPAKWSDQPKREQSLHKKAKDLKDSGQIIGERINKIKQMLQENSIRSNRNSQYLKKRLEETRLKSFKQSKFVPQQKSTIITNKSFNPFSSQFLAKKINQLSKS